MEDSPGGATCLQGELLTQREYALIMQGDGMLFYIDQPEFLAGADDQIPKQVFKSIIELYTRHYQWIVANKLHVYAAGSTEDLLPFFPAEHIIDNKVYEINIIDGKELDEDVRRN